MIFNPDNNRVDTFLAEVWNQPLGQTWNRVLALIAASAAAVTTAGVTAGSKAAVLAGAALLVAWTVAGFYNHRDDVYVRNEAADLAGLVKRVEHAGGLQSYNDTIGVHFKVLERLEDLLARLRHACDTIGDASGDTMLTGKRLAWSAAVRRRDAAHSVPHHTLWHLDDEWVDHNHHRDAAVTLEEELVRLVEAAELTASVAVSPSDHTDELNLDEIRRIVRSEQARTELGTYAAAHLELDPTIAFTERTTGTPAQGLTQTS